MKLSYMFIGATVLSLAGFVAVSVINANEDALLGLLILTIVLACCARGAQDRETMR